MPIEVVGEISYEVPLHTYLQHHLKHHPPADPTQPILVKFALNGATMTSGKKIQQELGGFQVLTPGELLSLVKSLHNCHIFIIYIGGETEEELHELLGNTKEVLHHPFPLNTCYSHVGVVPMMGTYCTGR